MTLLGIQWFWWLLGTFGTGGVAVLAYFFPAVALGIGQWLIKFVLTTPIGAALAAGAITWFVADTNRSIRDQHEFAARSAAFVQLQQQRDKNIAQTTREDVLRELASKSLADAKLDNDVKDFQNAFPPVAIAPVKDGPDPLRVGDASCRLRAIAGYSGCGPEGAAHGVPKARSRGARPGVWHWPKVELPQLIAGGAGSAPQGQ